jgi:hypothetical protein
LYLWDFNFLVVSSSQIFVANLNATLLVDFAIPSC